MPNPSSSVSVLAPRLLDNYGCYMHVQLYVDSENEQLHETYRTAIETHHTRMLSDMEHIDAGFDLFTPVPLLFESTKVNKLDTQVIACARFVDKTQPDKPTNTGFYLYPRSSISKTHLRLANNVGIIDAGYRGHLMGMFDLVYTDRPVTIQPGDRYLQLCAPGLLPILVELVHSVDQLGSISTLRGTGGFGST